MAAGSTSDPPARTGISSDTSHRALELMLSYPIMARSRASLSCAVMDVEACYRGLVDKGINKIAVVGDSAGGNLALVLLSIACGKPYR